MLGVWGCPPKFSFPRPRPRAGEGGGQGVGEGAGRGPNPITPWPLFPAGKEEVEWWVHPPPLPGKRRGGLTQFQTALVNSAHIPLVRHCERNEALLFAQGLFRALRALAMPITNRLWNRIRLPTRAETGSCRVVN